MSNRYAAYGAQLQRGDGADPDEVFETVAGVYDISGPSLSADVEDATAHDSTDGWEEAVKTVLRSGEPTFSLRLDPEDESQQQLVADLKDYDPHNYKIVFPDAGDTECDFAAFVTGFEITGPHDGVLEAELTLKPTGPVTFSWEAA